ncbi:MAG: 3-deoxy-8-phosphooctulonate synthase [Phycisphaerae bacterium]|nr:3-deoxy-8-phosphooctulonate synthase [Phycisphaerae bacterium]
MTITLRPHRSPDPRDAIAQRLDAWFSAPADQLLVIAGPCALESDAINRQIGETVRDACVDLGIPYVFKASFDKANRSSIRSARGPGADAGLDRLRRLRETLGVPVTTDIHAPEQAAPAAAAVDILQIPAFLCRQTDLLVAAATTGVAVNVKKGQFMAPDEMRNVVTKLTDAAPAGDAARIMLTERGTFFGYHRLVNDFIGIADLLALGRPVCFDATHSTQLPGGDKTSTGGRPERAPSLARAAIATGVHALFLECHPEPARATSDASTMQPLETVPALLRCLVAMRRTLAEHGVTAGR